MADQPRQPKDFDQFNPPKDVTNPNGATDPNYPAHMHKANERGEYLGEYVVVKNAEEAEKASKAGYHASPAAAIKAALAKTKRGPESA